MEWHVSNFKSTVPFWLPNCSKGLNCPNHHLWFHPVTWRFVYVRFEWAQNTEFCVISFLARSGLNPFYFRNGKYDVAIIRFLFLRMEQTCIVSVKKFVFWCSWFSNNNLKVCGFGVEINDVSNHHFIDTTWTERLNMPGLNCK